MKVGVPKEVKNREYRVALTPIGVHELVQHGHDVVVQKSGRLYVTLSLFVSPPPFTTVMLDFFPNGGFVSTTSRRTSTRDASSRSRRRL